ncbi:MAG TPA: tail fiber protein [Anaerolineae bacterium]
MSEPFLAEIRMVSFNFAPRGWAFCDGQLLSISQNQALFSLLGTTYGGDGRTTFALPDLRGRVPVHVSNSHAQGQKGGEESHTLTVQEMAQHTHPLQGSSSDADTPVPGGNVLAASAAADIYNQASNVQNMSAGAVASVGGGQSHNNMQPYLAVNFCIALQGIFPSRN